MEVELPDGRIAEFPDDMDRSQIAAVLQKKFPTPKSTVSHQQNQEDNIQAQFGRSGLANIGKDILESTVSAPGKLIKSALNIPEQLENLGQYRLEHGLLPTLGQSALGVGELGAKLFSAPQMAARYLGHKILPESVFTQNLMKTPTPYEFMKQGEMSLGLTPKSKGEEEARGVGELLAGGIGLSALKTMLLRTGALSTAATGGGGDPIEAALGGFIGEKAGRALIKAPKKYKEYKDIKKYSPEEWAKAVEEQENLVNTMQANKQKTAELMQNIDKLESKLAEIPDASKSLPDLRFEGQYENLTNLRDNANTNLKQAHESQSKQLGRGQDFELRAAPIVLQEVQNIKNEISPRYDTIRKASKDINIEVTNNKRAAEIQAEMDKLISKGIASPSNDRIYDSILQQLEEQWPGKAIESIPASDYINSYKATRDLSRVARQRSRQEGIPQDERQKWENRASQLEPLVREQRSVLQKDLPNNLFNDLLETDRLWAENVIPFYQNKIYQDVRQHELAPKNMIDVTAGNANHRTIMQRVIQNNPELNRLALGQRFSENPKNMLTAGERDLPYITAHSPTSALLELQNRAHTSYQKINKSLESLEPKKQFREEQQKGISKLTETQMAERNKITNTLKSLLDELKNIDKNFDLREIEKLGKTKEGLQKRQEYENRRKNLKNKIVKTLLAASGYALGGTLLDKIFKQLFK